VKQNVLSYHQNTTTG